MQPNQIEKPNIIDPVAWLLDTTCKNSITFLVDHIEWVILSRTGFILVRQKNLPFLELYIQVLGSFSENVNE